jgi:hypothetical protein
MIDLGIDVIKETVDAYYWRAKLSLLIRFMALLSFGAISSEASDRRGNGYFFTAFM